MKLGLEDISNFHNYFAGNKQQKDNVIFIWLLSFLKSVSNWNMRIMFNNENNVYTETFYLI